MEANNGSSTSSSSTSVTISETFKFDGKGTTLALLLLAASALVIALIMIRCIRGRPNNDNVDGQSEADNVDPNENHKPSLPGSVELAGYKLLRKPSLSAMFFTKSTPER